MAKKEKKQPEDDGPAGAPEWVVTFTDMISLLVTFFVLLMTFSSMEQYDYLKVDAWLTGKGGLHEVNGHTPIEGPSDDLITASNLERGALQPHSRPPEKLPESLEEMGQKRSDKDLAMDLENVADGLVIEFGADEAFAPGSAAISAELSRSLVEIGQVLENYPHLVVVEGFTDDRFGSNGSYDSPEALSFARASNAAQVLLSGSRLLSKQVQLSGLGPLSPRGDNGSPEGRQQNRRVQIRILSLSKLRASHIEAELKARKAAER